MSKHKQKFSFVVGNIGEMRSNIWKVVVNKNDIYLLAKSFGKSYKIALHESGTCQSELTSEFMATTSLPNSQRFLDKWDIQYEKGKATIAFAIIIPHSQLISFPNDVQMSQDLLYISPPSSDSAIEILIYKSGVYSDSIDAKIPDSYNTLVSFRLENGEWIVIMYHEYSLSESQQALIDEMSKIAAEKKAILGIQDQIIATSFGLCSSNGERRICEIYV